MLRYKLGVLAVSSALVISACGTNTASGESETLSAEQTCTDYMSVVGTAMGWFNPNFDLTTVTNAQLEQTIYSFKTASERAPDNMKVHFFQMIPPYQQLLDARKEGKSGQITVSTEESKTATLALVAECEKYFPSTPTPTPTPTVTPTPTRAVKPKPTAKPKPVKIPNTVGYMLPEAEDRLDRAGVRYSARPLDGIFGIIDKENWMVCKQIKLNSKRVRLDVAKYEC